MEVRMWIILHKWNWQSGAFVWVSLLNPVGSPEKQPFNLALRINGGEIKEKDIVDAIKEIKRMALNKKPRLKYSNYYINKDTTMANLITRGEHRVWYGDEVLDQLDNSTERKDKVRKMIKSCQWFIENAINRTIDN